MPRAHAREQLLDHRGGVLPVAPPPRPTYDAFCQLASGHRQSCGGYKGIGASMRENTLKQQLYAGKAAFGVMCTFPSPPVVEMLGYLGFDWILLDNEHGSITVDTAESCIVAAELSGMAPIVRPVRSEEHTSELQ